MLSNFIASNPQRYFLRKVLPLRQFNQFIYLSRTSKSISARLCIPLSLRNTLILFFICTGTSGICFSSACSLYFIAPSFYIAALPLRNGQIERARQLINSGKYKQRPKNQNDPHCFIARNSAAENGEVCSKEVAYLNTSAIQEKKQYDGFYVVCTNLDDMSVEDIVRINKKRWEIEECFRIMKTDFKARPVYLQTEDHIKAHFITCFIALVIYRILEKKLNESYTCEDIIATMRDMLMSRPGNKLGYIPAYTRTDLTDALHETAGFRTDYEIISDVNMRKTLRESRKKK